MTREAPNPIQDQLRRGLPRWQRWREKLIESMLFGSGLLSILITLAIAAVVIYGSYYFFTHTDVLDERGYIKGLREMTLAETLDRVVYFFIGTEWSAGFNNPRYGILPLVAGTLMVAVIAAFIALPIGLITAIFLSEYADARIRAFVKPTLELLAGIPTVVYGYFAYTAITPALKNMLDWVRNCSPLLHDFVPQLGDPYNQISGGIVVGIMIIPLVASLSEDAIRAVPRSLRDGSYALGANQFQTSTQVVVPSALSGIIASFLLAISRAIGETMAVSLACGGLTKFTLNPFEGVATMTGFIVATAKGDNPANTTIFYSMFAVAGVLFFVTLGMNVLGQNILRRYRMVYQ